jgi:hypothetical protein
MKKEICSTKKEGMNERKKERKRKKQIKNEKG